MSFLFRNNEVRITANLRTVLYHGCGVRSELVRLLILIMSGDIRPFRCVRVTTTHGCRPHSLGRYISGRATTASILHTQAMLLTTLASAVPIGSLAFRHSSRAYGPLLITVARRHMTSGAPVDNLSSKEPKEPALKGTEGPHISADRFFLRIGSAY